MRYALLPQRGFLALSGEDTIEFLQGLITSNALRLREGKSIYAALLSPQGKFLHDFFLIPSGDKILLDGEKSRLDDLVGRLKLYKLRSKVTIEPLPDMAVAAAWGDGPFTYPLSGEGLVITEDPRLPELGLRIIGKKDDVVRWCGEKEEWSLAHADDYNRMRLELGIPEGGRDMIEGKTLLMEMFFEALHGVDFSKGCYVGQEVTARSKHRGQVKKQLYRVRTNEGELPESGTPIMAGDTQVGELRSHARDVGLAILRVEEVDKAAAQKRLLRAGNTPLVASVPEWAVAPKEHK